MAVEQKPIETTTFRYEDKDYPLWKKHTPRRLAYDIVNVNRKTIYTSINMIGQPGWSKTTTTQALVHEIHDIAPHFAIRWYFKRDILRIDKILESLPKLKPVILVFDDVSWILTNRKLLPEDKKNELLEKLTTVREILDPETKRTNCMILMDYHYSFAVDKPFRQSPFSVQVSMTPEEKTNYLKGIGYSRRNAQAINKFSQILESAYKYDNFRIPAPEGFGQEYLYYKTDAPFRPAMVFNMFQIHLMLSHLVNCEICSPKKKYDKPDPDWLWQLVDSEGIDRVHRDWRMYTALTTGKLSLLHRKDARIIRHIRDEITQYKIPLAKIEEILGQTKQLPKKDQKAALVKAITELEGKQINEIDSLEKQIKQAVEASDVVVDQEKLGDDENDEKSIYQMFKEDEEE